MCMMFGESLALRGCRNVQRAVVVSRGRRVEIFIFGCDYETLEIWYIKYQAVNLSRKDNGF